MQFFVFTRELLQAIWWRSKYNGCTQRIWKQRWGFEPKVEGSSPSKTFIFIFYVLLSQRSRKCLAMYMFAEKKHFLMYYAHVKRHHSVKWRGLYGDTATMQELLLKTCTSSAWRKRSLEWNCHWIVYGTGLHRHLRRKCHWMTLTKVMYGGPSSACTPWRRFCQPLVTSEQSSNRVLVTLAERVSFSKISFIRSLLTHAVGCIKKCWWRDKM